MDDFLLEGIEMPNGAAVRMLPDSVSAMTSRPLERNVPVEGVASVPLPRTTPTTQPFWLRERPGRADFSREELEDVGNWETVVGGEKALVIPIGLDTPRVARADLEAVLPSLDAYRSSGDPREVHVRLHRHKEKEFLEWLDWSGYVEPRPLEAVRAAIDALGKNELLKDVWIRLTPEEFHRELGGDGFRYGR